MIREVFIAGILLLLAAGGAMAQQEAPPPAGASANASAAGQADASARPGEAGASLAQGTEVSATLTQPLDAGKAKPGDEVNARAAKDVRSGGKVVVPRGARLVGRVTRAEPRKSGGDAKGKSASALGIVFERAVLKDGSEIALNGAIAAVGAAQAAGSTGSARTTGSAGGTAGGLTGTVGGTIGGVAGATSGAAGSIGSTVGATAGAATRSAGSVGGVDAAGGLRSGSRGVFGLSGMDVAADATGSAGGSVITSAHRTVRLESGTQMLLVAGGSAGKAKPAPAEPPTKEPVDHR